MQPRGCAFLERENEKHKLPDFFYKKNPRHREPERRRGPCPPLRKLFWLPLFRPIKCELAQDFSGSAIANGKPFTGVDYFFCSVRVYHALCDATVVTIAISNVLKY